MSHRIDLQSDKRGYGADTLVHNGKAVGKSEKPIYAAARWLLENNAAFAGDTVATYRGNTLSMSGIVGDLAKLTVVEHDDPGRHGRPTLEIVPWSAFPTHAVGAQNATMHEAWQRPKKQAAPTDRRAGR